MTLVETLVAVGMTPPASLVTGKWLRFPGTGKGKYNRAGWCRLITPTLAIYGDWSSGLSEVWRDDAHREDTASRRLLEEARKRERQFAAEQKRKQAQAAEQAQALIDRAVVSGHPYLAAKGFPSLRGLVAKGKLLVPVRDLRDYARVLSIQEIAEDGSKRFLPGGRTRGGVYRLGVPLWRAKRVVLCEGYATGLSLDAALRRLPSSHSVVVCFSAMNLGIVAESVPKGFICADNDATKTGEMAAQKTGLKWTMPPDVGTDFNDLHQQHGIVAVTQALRAVFELAGVSEERLT